MKLFSRRPPRPPQPPRPRRPGLARLLPGLVSALIVILNGLLHLIAASFTGAMWPRALGWYSLFLGAARLLLFFEQLLPGHDPARPWRTCIRIARLLRVIDLVMLVMTLIIAFGFGGYHYPDWMLWWIAAWVAVRLILSISKFFRGHRHTSPETIAAGALDSTAALMSLLSLTTVLTEKILEAGSLHQRLANLIAGVVISGLCLISAQRTLILAEERAETLHRPRKPFFSFFRRRDR